jgi:vitamin-K-epoxide reductase (warfarin-sensitive)
MLPAVNSLSRRLMTLIALLAVAGIGVSSVSLQHHYASSKTEYCELGETFNCDLVNRSAYSSIAGIPVALIGILGYLTLAGLATVYRGRSETPKLLLGGAAAGLIFALYLTYVEARVLGVWCILCVSSLVLISSITLLACLIWVRTRGSSE